MVDPSAFQLVTPERNGTDKVYCPRRRSFNVYIPYWALVTEASLIELHVRSSG